MATRTRQTAKRGTDAYIDAYCRLVNCFTPAPIRTKKELAAASDIAWELAAKGEDALTPAEADYLEIVSDLIEAHEANALRQLKADAGDGIDILKTLLDDHGMTASDLGRLLGNRSLGSKILRRERGLSKRHVQVLSERFGIDRFVLER